MDDREDEIRKGFTKLKEDFADIGRQLGVTAHTDPAQLTEFETWWRDRYTFLLSKGYQLRPRFKPGWVASWKRTGKRFYDCEDAIGMRVRFYFVK